MTLACLHHRSSTPQPRGACWEFSPVSAIGPVIYLRLVIGGRVVDVDVPVCSEARRVPDRWIVSRLGGATGAWTISAKVPDPPSGFARPAAFAPGLVPGRVELLSSPPHIDDELGKL